MGLSTSQLNTSLIQTNFGKQSVLHLKDFYQIYSLSLSLSLAFSIKICYCTSIAQT